MTFGFGAGTYQHAYLSIPVVNEPGAGSVDWNAIRNALDNKYAQGEKTLYQSRWWRKVDRPYRSLLEEEALIRLWKKTEAVTFFAQHLEKMSSVLAKTLEEQISQMPNPGTP